VTVLLFIPRWAFLAPIAVLAIASALARRPGHWAMQAAVGLLVAGPLMGLSLPVSQLWTPRPQGTTFRVLCFNTGPGRLDGGGLIPRTARERIDFIPFQQRPLPAPEFEAFLARGWYRDSSRFIVSRYPIVAELPPLIHRLTDDDRHPARVTRVRVRA